MEQRAVQRNSWVGGQSSALLFVPGDRPDRVHKARGKGARVVVIDLEDAVPQDQKDRARELTVAALADASPEVSHLVRVNPVAERALVEADLAALLPVRHLLDGIVVPKVKDAAELAVVDRLLGQAPGSTDDRPVPLLATIESAVGLREASSIAAAGPSVHTLLFGAVDLAADLGVTATPDGLELLTARSTLVHACAAARRARPIDGPWLNIADTEAHEISARHARRLGYGGKVAIHPGQLPVIDRVFAPTESEIAWASQVVEAYDAALADGVGVLRMDDGTFVDVPVAARARSILASARSAGGAP